VARKAFLKITEPYVGNKIESLFEFLIVIIDVQHGLFPEAQSSNACRRSKREEFRLVATDVGYLFPSCSLSSPAFKRLNERVHVNVITNRM
jgi:hypothetical protein